VEQPFFENIYEDDDELFRDELDEAVLWALQDTVWEEQASQIDGLTLLEDRIAFYQQLRKEEALPDEATFFLIAWVVEEIVGERAQVLHDQQFATRFAELEAKYHIDPDTLEENSELPEEYVALNIEFAQAIKALFLATFQTFGEHKMASLYRTQPEEFDRRCDVGHTFFFGEEGDDNDTADDVFHD